MRALRSSQSQPGKVKCRAEDETSDITGLTGSEDAVK